MGLFLSNDPLLPAGFEADLIALRDGRIVSLGDTHFDSGYRIEILGPGTVAKSVSARIEEVRADGSGAIRVFDDLTSLDAAEICSRGW